MYELYLLRLPLGKRDRIIATEWRNKGADLGDAFCCLAMAYSEGVSDDERDKIISKVFDNVKFLADNGDRFAQGIVGDCYCSVEDEKNDVENALRFHLMAAEQGVVHYIDSVGLDYDICEDYTSANEWFRKAGEAGDFRGWKHLASNYQYGNGIAEDKNKAIELYKKSYEMSEGTDGFSALAIGEIYYDDNDYASANDWYHKAEEAGGSTVWSKLANKYRFGIGVIKDKNKAIELYKKAYEMSSDGFYAIDIGDVYSDVSDYTSANEWYRKAGEAGNGLGWCHLADSYCNGNGVDLDQEKAIELFRKSYEMHDESAGVAAISIGELYSDNNDYSSANEWYRKAGEAGNGMGWFNLAGNYCRGNGVDANEEKAIELFKKSYEMLDGFAGEAAISIGRLYSIDEKFSVANEWFRKAGEAGNGWGWHHLAHNYFDGNGVTKNYNKAIELYKKSYEMDDESSGASAYYIGYIFCKHDDIENEFEWVKKSAEKNYGSGMLNLGRCYKYGRGTKTNFEEARKWLQKALKAGIEAAENELNTMDCGPIKASFSPLSWFFS